MYFARTRSNGKLIVEAYAEREQIRPETGACPIVRGPTFGDPFPKIRRDRPHFSNFCEQDFPHK
jgi:hypothetical protein